MISDRASNCPVSRRGVIVGVAPIIAAPLRRWPARSWMEQRSANGAQLPKRLCRADGSSCPRTCRSLCPSGSAQLGGMRSFEETGSQGEVSPDRTLDPPQARPLTR